MRSCIFLPALLCIYILPAAAQERLITCRSERNADNSISIFSDSQAYGEYTMKLVFSSFNGYRSSSLMISNYTLATVMRGQKELLKLTPDKQASSFSYQYTYQYFPGRALRKSPDSAFLYLLPAAAGKQLLISKVNAIEDWIGQKRPEEFYGAGFIYHLGDTICAARAGTVYECSDAVKEGEQGAQTYKSGRNNIAVQQRDGSICRYEALAPIRLLVSAGDEVLPGKPLAVFNKESEKLIVLFSAYYLDEKKLSLYKSGENISSSYNYIYIPLHFYTGDNNNSSAIQVNKLYTVQHPKDIVAAEMSKKEKKKLGY
ncbi:MAG: hypothetical protein ABIQ88_20910 [Chitinophagaceae bacterium]